MLTKDCSKKSSEQSKQYNWTNKIDISVTWTKIMFSPVYTTQSQRKTSAS